MSNRPISGTDGRVRNGSNNPIALINSWKLNKKTNVVPYPHFEAGSDGDGNVWTPKLTGLSDASGSLEGVFDTDPTNVTDGSTSGIVNGTSMNVDLIISKANTWGFYNVPVIFTNFQLQVAVENQPAKFSCDFEVNGNPGKSTGTPS